MNPEPLRRVREIENAWIPLRDGTRLAVRLWLPEDAGPVPAILEYLPYRKDDETADADARRHRYFAEHGFAAARVDIRGTGDSDGLIGGEYTRQEHDDALEVIAWLAEQPWCSGAVGMIGYSWGGFNGLQIAARRPPALKAIVTAHSTDDRYTDDCHYMGGCLLGSDMLKWASWMRAIDALPPDPRFRDDWRDVWLTRLRETPAFIEDWVSHQTRDDFWKHGSVAEDYSAIEAATLVVGGWADPYTNAVPRLLEHLTCPRAGIIGPWTHALPHDALPGPSIGFLQECLRWFGRYLAGSDTGVERDPLLRVYLAERSAPEACLEFVDGCWVGVGAWPPPAAMPVIWPLGRSGDSVVVATPQHCGATAGVWCPVGLDDELAVDQRPDDDLSARFDFEPLGEPLVVLGRPVVRLRLSADRPRANVAVRLCELLPSGESLLVTWALLDLTHRDGDEAPEPLVPGAEYDIAVPLNVIGRSFERGARLRLAVSTAYWPHAWPTAEPAGVTLDLGSCALELPAIDAGLLALGAPGVGPFGEPESAARLKGPGSFARRRRERTSDEATGLHAIVDTMETRIELPATGTVVEWHAEDGYHIATDDPLSARCTTLREATFTRDSAGWCTRVRAVAEMTATPLTFEITDVLEAFDGDVRVFEHTQRLSIPRA